MAARLLISCRQASSRSATPAAAHVSGDNQETSCGCCAQTDPCRRSSARADLHESPTDIAGTGLSKLLLPAPLPPCNAVFTVGPTLEHYCKLIILCSLFPGCVLCCAMPCCAGLCCAVLLRLCCSLKITCIPLCKHLTEPVTRLRFSKSQ